MLASKMDSIPLPTQLLPCLAVPFVELFPDLCLGWWTPPSLNLNQYKKMWYLRCALQFIAWFPLFEMLLPISNDGSNFSLLVIGTAASFALRNFLQQKEIERVQNTPIWKSDLTPDKRRNLFVVITSTRPSDINKFDEIAARYVTLPSKIAAFVMYGIVNTLHSHLSDDDKMWIMGALAAYVMGGIGIGGTRHGSVALDCFFRCMFSAGFVAILHYVAEVSDIVLIKSM